MSIDLSITIPERDRRRLQDAMKLYRDVLHKTAPQTVRATAGFIGRSLAASTRLAPKTRKVKAEMLLTNRGGLRARWYAERWRDGTKGQAWMPWKVQSEPEAMLRKEAQIKRRGLAKAAWRTLGSGRWPGTTSFLVGRGIRTGTKRENHLRDVNPSIVMHNRIGYAEDAFRTKGKRAINTVGNRAARAMEREVLRKLTGIRLK